MFDKTLEDLVEECPYDTKLAVTAWAMKHIVEHAQDPGSFRYLIYERMGFGPDAYVPLYEAGGMEISNEFDMERIDNIRAKVREEKIDALKPLLGLCDEPGCFNSISTGWPTKDGGYRMTCSEHYRKSHRKEE
jgi:hypothetical protein